jgi:hypothetical protein
MKTLMFRVILGLVAMVMTLLAMEVVMRLVSSARDRDPSKTWDRPDRLYFAGRECPWTRGATNFLRVAVIGDSFAEGAGVQFSDSFGVRLESLLNLNTNLLPAEVRVWAKGGYNTQMELRFLKEAIQWRPHVLILQVFLNDTENPMNKEELGQWRSETMPRKPSSGISLILSKTRVGAWIYTKMEHRRCDKAYLRYMERTTSPDYSGWQNFVAALKVFRESCDREQIKLVTVIFPELEEVGHYRFDKIHAQIGQVLKGEGMIYLDLLDEYRGKRTDRMGVVPKLDSHPSEIAHRIASEAIFRYLLDQELIDESYEPQNQSRGRQSYWRRMNQYMNHPLEPVEIKKK